MPDAETRVGRFRRWWRRHGLVSVFTYEYQQGRQIRDLAYENEMQVGTIRALEKRVNDLELGLILIVNETDNNTFGKPSYDMTLDHLHDVASGTLYPPDTDGSPDAEQH